ncbi:NAD(P)-dependent oxidoreductase [Nocardia sp. NPDC055321]
MKITVLGANGGTGTEIVHQALAAGHDVTAVVRDPATMRADLRARADLVTADPLNADDLRDAVAGRDVVLTAIGGREMRAPTSICADGIRAAITALDTHGRLIMVSNSAMAPGPGDDAFTRFVVKPLILHPLLRGALADMADAEARLRNSRLDWTVVRAGRLTDGRGRGRYRSAVDRNVLGGFQISRSNLATAMLDAAASPSSIGQVISVAN